MYQKLIKVAAALLVIIILYNIIPIIYFNIKYQKDIKILRLVIGKPKKTIKWSDYTLFVYYSQILIKSFPSLNYIDYRNHKLPYSRKSTDYWLKYMENDDTENCINATYFTFYLNEYSNKYGTEMLKLAEIKDIIITWDRTSRDEDL